MRFEVVLAPLSTDRNNVTSCTAGPVAPPARWRGEEGFTTAAVCRATLVDSTGEVIAEGIGKVFPLGRPNELENYPYRVGVFIRFGLEPMNAEEIDEFSCTSV